MAQTKKTRMQMLIAGIALGAGLLFVLVNFLLLPAIKGLKHDKSTLRKINDDLEIARGVVRMRSEVLAQLENERDRLLALMPYVPLPVLGNYLLGMSERVREWGRLADLNITEITNNDVLSLADGDALFNIHRVRVTAFGEYQNLIDFLEIMDEHNPFVVVSSLNITARPGSPEKHEIRLLLGWLVWVQPDQLPEYVFKAELEE
ncbi:MAG: hypothetical protein ABR497_03115 [Kiritimatiellia bacterium]|nr:hypothetical protein [Lentisphaerota bacterium]